MPIASTRMTASHLRGNGGISDPLHDDPAEQAGGPQGEHEDHDDQRHGELLAVADDVDAGQLLDLVAGVGDHVLEHADDKPPTTAPPGLPMPPIRAPAKA